MNTTSKKSINHSKPDELTVSSSFSKRIYSEVEEVGWENLVKLGEDMRFLSFRVLDNKGREHILEVSLDNSYPKCPPSISADIPYNFNLEWTPSSRLKDVVPQFREHLDKLQHLWSTLDCIDQTFWVTAPEHSRFGITYRQISIGNDCYIMLFVNASDPLSLPECRFLGSDDKVNVLMGIWRRNSKRWSNDKSFPENLECIFGIQFPPPPHVRNDEAQVECGICYAQYLPTDDELGAASGSATDYTCENGHCKRAFHSICLADWLRSITTTRQSFDVLFGNCPYCSDPVAVKISTKK